MPSNGLLKSCCRSTKLVDLCDLITGTELRNGLLLLLLLLLRLRLSGWLLRGLLG